LILVTHVITRTNIGGPSVIISSLLADTAHPDIEQRLVRGSTTAEEGDYFDDLALGNKIITIEGLGRRIKPWDDLRTLATLIRHFRMFRPEVVHTHMAKAGALGRIAAFIARVPIRVHTYHGHLLSGYFGPTMTKVVVLAERLLRPITTHAVVVGRRVRHDLIAAKIVSEDDSSVINPGVGEIDVVSSPEARQRLNLPESGVVVMFIGRFAAIKRPDRFIHIARRFSDRPDVHFVMVGDGPLRATIERDCTDVANLNFRTWQRDLGLVLGAADVVVMCSDNEGVPLLLIEAGMAGRAAVSTRVGSVEDVIQDGVNGFLVERDDHESLVNAVRRLIDDAALRTGLGIAARSIALAGFMSTVSNAAHAALYRELVRDARECR
jgi:glycosyltransferase involved in cell wall biosynthesis